MALWRRPWARATALLTPPLAWFLVIYLASLVVLLITSFWRINSFTTNIERVWNLDNFKLLVENSAYRSIILRTAAMAAAVTPPNTGCALRGRTPPPVGELPRPRLRVDPDLHP
jgi:putative spermidine/putrescine transport system permease protein